MGCPMIFITIVILPCMDETTTGCEGLIYIKKIATVQNGRGTLFCRQTLKMFMSYADCCATFPKQISSKPFKAETNSNVWQSERYDRCTSENCIFCKETQRTGYLAASELSQEIRKIPYRMMCRTIGVTSGEIQILDDDDFIENGFKVEDFEGYYTNGFNECIKQLVIKPKKITTPKVIVEIEDRAQQTDAPTTAISTLRAKDPYYLSINTMIFGDHGQAIPKWKTKEFCAAAENFALFGHMHDEGGDGDSKLSVYITKPSQTKDVNVKSVKRQIDQKNQQHFIGIKSHRVGPMFAPLVPMPPPMHPAPNFNYSQAILGTNPFGMSRLLTKHPAPGVFYHMPASYNGYTQSKVSQEVKSTVRCKSVKRI